MQVFALFPQKQTKKYLEAKGYSFLKPQEKKEEREENNKFSVNIIP